MKRYRKILIYGSVLVVVSFVILEILLRVFFPQYKTFTQPDDLLRYRLMPNSEYTFIAPEGCPGWQSSGMINSHGLMDDEHAYEPPADTTRILAPGDSFTEGLQFERESRWTDLLEIQLNADAGTPRYEVINAGLSGMGTTQEYLYYTEYGRRYSPDLTILMFAWNDFADNSPDLHYDALRPFHRLDNDGDLVLDMSFNVHPGYIRVKQMAFFRQNFYSYQFIRQVWQQRQIQNTQTDIAASPERLQHQIEAIQVTERVLLMFRDAVEADGGDFLLVIGTVPEDDWLPAFEALYPEQDDLTIDGAMMRFADEHDIPALNLIPAQDDYLAETGLVTRGCPENGFMGHWNRAGHEIAAEVIFAYLRE